MCANSPGHFTIAMMVELPLMHRVYSPVVLTIVGKRLTV